MKRRILSILMALCMVAVFVMPMTALGMTNGVYPAEAEGHNGPVKVEVTVADGKVTNVAVIEHKETAGLSDPALERIPTAIVEGQTLAVDTVAGATVTSKAILTAVEEALKAAGADVEAMKVANAFERTKGEDQTVDVVIVGAGLAGIMAAYELKDNHPELSYVLLEKLDVSGGSLPTTGGAIISTDAKLFVEGGFNATTADITEMFDKTSDTKVRGALVENTFDKSGAMLDKLLDWGVKFRTPPTLSSDKYSQKVYALWAENAGPGFNEGLQAHMASNGINLVTGAKVTELVVDGDTVKGVKVETRDSTYQVNAKAVLLVTGGFGASPEYMAEYAPKYVSSLVSANAGATGDGITMTRQFGTKVVGDGVMGSPRNEAGQPTIGISYLVNAKGQRFIDESQPGYAILRAMADGDGFAYALVDADYADQETLKARNLTPYDSVEALADAMGFERGAFLADLEAYNAAVAAGKDPALGLPLAKAQPLDKAPFYVEKIVLRHFGTIPGIEISDMFEVLNGKGEPVKGLYAAGELTAGNAFTRQYPGGGVGISYAANSGRAAAEKIAEDLK